MIHIYEDTASPVKTFMSNPLNSSGIYIVTAHTATWDLRVTLARSAIFFLKAECLANCFLCLPLTPPPLVCTRRSKQAFNDTALRSRY